jgi:hypothetical protein
MLADKTTTKRTAKASAPAQEQLAWRIKAMTSKADRDAAKQFTRLQRQLVHLRSTAQNLERDLQAAFENLRKRGQLEQYRPALAPTMVHNVEHAEPEPTDMGPVDAEALP